MYFPLFCPLKTIKRSGKILITSIIRMCKGKINEPKAENHLKWKTWLWFSAFYYFYFTRKTAVLKVGTQVLVKEKRNSMLFYDIL